MVMTAVISSRDRPVHALLSDSEIPSQASRGPEPVRPPGAWVVQLSKMESCPSWQPWLMSLNIPEEKDGDRAGQGDAKTYSHIVTIARPGHVNFTIPVTGP
jgi:hypothetical protein